MDVSKIVELVNALEETWISQVLVFSAMGFGLFGFSCIIKAFCSDSIMFCGLVRNIEKYIEFSLLRDFPEYVKTEKSAKWLDKVRLWFIRNS